MADMEMVHRARDRPVYMMDYFTSMVTPEYLESLREEFQILNNIDLVVPCPNDLASRLPSGHITLLVEFFQVGLHCLSTPF